MRTYTIALLSLLLFSIAAFPQNRLSVRNLRVERDSTLVEVSFDATGTSAPFSINSTYTFTPLFYKENHLLRLSPLVIGGRRAGILHARRGAAPVELHRKGDTVSYRCTLPYEAWMANGKLALEERVQGCCRTETSAPMLLSDCVLPQAAALPALPEPVAAPVATISTGKRLAEKYSFITPASESDSLLNRDQSLRMGKAADERQQHTIEQELSRSEEGALRIYFEVARSAIDSTFGTNAASLAELAAAVNAIGNSTDSRIAHIVIAGFASPEGTLDFNERLAWNRAQALRTFLTSHTSVPWERIHLYNGGENWMGLRKLVAAGDMPGKAAVLRIIDTVAVTRGRERQLMKLDGGNTYRYLMQHYFPQLRHAAHIRVYYR